MLISAQQLSEPTQLIPVQQANIIETFKIALLHTYAKEQIEIFIKIAILIGQIDLKDILYKLDVSIVELEKDIKRNRPKIRTKRFQIRKEIPNIKNIDFGLQKIEIQKINNQIATERNDIDPQISGPFLSKNISFLSIGNTPVPRNPPISCGTITNLTYEISSKNLAIISQKVNKNTRVVITDNINDQKNAQERQILAALKRQFTICIQTSLIACYEIAVVMRLTNISQNGMQKAYMYRLDLPTLTEIISAFIINQNGDIREITTLTIIFLMIQL
uniref:Uncharacterized protein n=1 Tax=Spironucleus salmonicida TaxID=348837 RepID=V6LDG6_9EUKA|eukprot:EST41706.1 Hypothetical protein SS50377_18793 [Spironucleus salmonicida]